MQIARGTDREFIISSATAGGPAQVIRYNVAVIFRKNMEFAKHEETDSVIRSDNRDFDSLRRGRIGPLLRRTGDRPG
jgi:hypothetical protein